MDEILSTRSSFGEELPINSSEEDFCLHCGVTVTPENDSGWEAFWADGTTTQKVCRRCDRENDKACKKAEERDERYPG